MIGRTNANNVDLNRDFPDLDRIVYSSEGTQREYNNHLMEYVKHLDHKIQPETESVMKMIMENPFVVRFFLALRATSTLNLSQVLNDQACVFVRAVPASTTEPLDTQPR